MSNEDSQNKRIAEVYADLVSSPKLESLDDDSARRAATSLSTFGSDGFAFLERKMRSAEPEELRKLRRILRHMDYPEIGDHFTIVVVERVVPLDIKVKFFETMADMGHSIESKFLQQMQEADELYHQLSSQLRSEDDDSLKRAYTLIDDFVALKENLKLSFLQELGDKWGEKALPWLVHLAGKDASVDPVIIDLISRFPGPAAVKALHQLADSSDKDVAKRAKKSLYVLKEKGVDVSAGEKEEGDSTVIREEKDEDDEAWATTLDSFGARLLVLVTPALSRLLVCRISVDDKHGMLRFSAGEMPRKGFRDFMRELKEHVRGQQVSSLVKIDPDHCRWLVQKAYELNAESGYLVPEGFKRYRYRIKPPEGYDPETRFAEIQPDENDERWASNHPDEFFMIPEISIWMIEREQLLPYARRYMQMAESNLVLDESQRRTRLNDIVKEYAEEYFDEARTERLISRLRETAYMVSCKGRAEDARRLLACANGLAGSSKLDMHGFLTSYMLRSIIGTIQAFAQEEERQQQGGHEGHNHA